MRPQRKLQRLHIWLLTLRNTLNDVKRNHSQIKVLGVTMLAVSTATSSSSDVADAGKRVGLIVTQYDFSEPQYGKEVCDRVLFPMKSAIRRYCSEGNDILSAKDNCTALSERPVRDTTAVYTEKEEQESHGVPENVSAQHSPRHPICYDS